MKRRRHKSRERFVESVQAQIDRHEQLAALLQSTYRDADRSDSDTSALARILDRIYLDRAQLRHSISTPTETTISYIRYLHGLINLAAAEIEDDEHSLFPEDGVPVEFQRRMGNARDEAEVQRLSLTQEEYDARTPFSYERNWDDNCFLPDRPMSFVGPFGGIDWEAWEALHLYDSEERFPWLRLKDRDEALAFFRSPMCFLNSDFEANSLGPRVFHCWISREYERQAPDAVYEAYDEWNDEQS